jgi:2-dehydropantoate 2-reductase
MKLHIMGAGAMGCLWAAHLQYGTPSTTVTFIDSRPRNDQELTKELSFTVSSPFLPHIPDNEILSFRLASSVSDEPLHCLFVCTKSFDALKGLESLKGSINTQTIIVLFQNGLGSQYGIVQAFPNNPIFAAVTTEGANKSSAKQIIHAGKGITRIGPLTSSAQDKSCYQDLLTHLQANKMRDTIEIQYEESIWQALWHKLIINCAINPYTALLNCPNGEVNSSQRFRSEWPELRKELAELLNKATHPLTEQEIETLVFDVMFKTRTNISSMLQDIRAGKQTEIADINGFAASFLSSHQSSNEINKKLEQDVLKLSQP